MVFMYTLLLTLFFILAVMVFFLLALTTDIVKETYFPELWEAAVNEIQVYIKLKLKGEKMAVKIGDRVITLERRFGGHNVPAGVKCTVKAKMHDCFWHLDETGTGHSHRVHRLDFRVIQSKLLNIKKEILK